MSSEAPITLIRQTVSGQFAGYRGTQRVTRFCKSHPEAVEVVKSLHRREAAR